jgi:hypothetical protein
MYYLAFPELMNSSTSRSMSFSHETSGATVIESQCYGKAIGSALEQVLTAGPDETSAPAEVGAGCTGIRQNTCAYPPPPPKPVSHHEAYDIVGAGSADVNGRYTYRLAPGRWPDPAPFYQKDDLHSLYRYHGRWYICHTGVSCYYDAPSTSDPSPEPPSTGWGNGGNRTGVAPAPRLQAVGDVQPQKQEVNHGSADEALEADQR